jgi:hypothetical protein
MGLFDEMDARATDPLNCQNCYAGVSPVCRAAGPQRRSMLI